MLVSCDPKLIWLAQNAMGLGQGLHYVMIYHFMKICIHCSFECDMGKYYPAKPSYSHCAKLGRSDCHFSTAARVKKTVTPPTDKTVTVLALVR